MRALRGEYRVLTKRPRKAEPFRRVGSIQKQSLAGQVRRGQEPVGPAVPESVCTKRALVAVSRHSVKRRQALRGRNLAEE